MTVWKSCAAVMVLGLCGAAAEVIGVNTPTLPLNEQRVHTLPASEQGPWLEYLQRSRTQMAADKAALAAEREGLATVPELPQQGYSARAIPLERPAAFYRSAEALRVADNIVSFQTPAGGWSKNLSLRSPRLRGQAYATSNLAPVGSAPGDFDKPLDENWHYVGTLDNDATNTELHFLGRVATALPGQEGETYRRSFERGVGYLLAAQFPNGGWPQVWPLEGGYHDALTFNDDAVTESADLLRDVAAGTRAGGADAAPENYSFVPAALRERARVAAAKAIGCVLRAQIVLPAAAAAEPQHRSGQVLTVWAQQYDPLTLAPESARNYEMPALSAGESASAVEFLMSLPHPSAEVVRAVDAAVEWFNAHRIMGYEWTGGRSAPGGRHLVARAGAGPLWPRYTSLTTGQPIFGDRDKTIHNDVMELSLERRNGYAWYGAAPERVLAAYPAWKAGVAAQASGGKVRR